MTSLENNTPVYVKYSEEIHFHGKVVGVQKFATVENYIVKCTDGFIPNSTYPYDSCIIPKHQTFSSDELESPLGSSPEKLASNNSLLEEAQQPVRRSGTIHYV